MPDIMSEKFSQWTKGQNPLEARISVFRKIRDIGRINKDRNSLIRTGLNTSYSIPIS